MNIFLGFIYYVYCFLHLTYLGYILALRMRKNTLRLTLLDSYLAEKFFTNETENFGVSFLPSYFKKN